MSRLTRALLSAAAIGMLPTRAAYAESVLRKPTPALPIIDEPAPVLSVDAPLAGPLADRGAVIVPYRTENLRILPVFGSGALGVSPRAGHLHVTVDDLPWHWPMPAIPRP